jgi:protein TonB
MKIFLFLVMSFFVIQMVSAQETITVSNDKVYSTNGVDVKPEFPGGVTEFYRYIANNYKLPKVKKLVGKVYVSYVVEKDGSIDEVKVLKDIGYGTGEEAIRVLNNSPKWIPAEQNGEKVRCSYTLPIAIDTR